MSRVFIRGSGAVSPAGWGVPALIEALEKQAELPIQKLAGPAREFQVRTVPSTANRPPCLAHPRLRRASAISQYATAAAIEALGDLRAPGQRLGIVVGVHAASIRYSERFFSELLRDPATASPAVFPETVINAPASHLASSLGSTDLTYSLLGDQTAFLQALAVGANWLATNRADIVLAISSEETAWTVSSCANYFSHETICSEGAGALCLMREPGENGVELTAISDPCLFAGAQSRAAATAKVASQFLPGSIHEILCDSRTGLHRWDQFETGAWQDWKGTTLSPRAILGEALSAASAWQFIAAVDRLRSARAPRAVISVAGSNQQAIAASLARAA